MTLVGRNRRYVGISVKMCFAMLESQFTHGKFTNDANVLRAMWMIVM